MSTISVDELINKTSYTLFESQITANAKCYSVSLNIEWKVPGLCQEDNVFHVHIDLIQHLESNAILLVNNTPYQMISYTFWQWLENSAPSDFMGYYLSKMFHIIDTDNNAPKLLQ